MHGLELDEEDDGLGEGFMSAAGIGSNNRGHARGDRYMG